LRHFNEKEPNYYDDEVDAYIRSVGDEPSSFDRYVVVPKRLGLAVDALKRYDREPHPFSPEICRLYDIAGDWLEKEFGHYLSDSRVMTYDAVIEWLRPMRSPGYPWTLKYEYKVDYWLSPDAPFYSRYWDVLSTPEYIRFLCSVTIKEEVRPREKVDRGEVRTIVAMDVNHVVAHSMLCLHQNNRLIASHLKHSSALGMDTFNGGFHRLDAKMSRFGGGRNVIELDGKKFDGRFRYYCMQKIRDFRFKMLAPEFRTPENRVRLFNLYYELAHSPLVNVDGFVFGRLVGNPSGQACTTPDNTFKNFMDMVVLWHLIMPEEYHTYEKFSEFLTMCICGDDII